MPDRLQLDEEFVVEENVHTDIQKRAPSASEGVTSKDVMEEASNLSSERKSKMETQTTRMGPLTFDLNPQLEEDDHIPLKNKFGIWIQ